MLVITLTHTTTRCTYCPNCIEISVPSWLRIVEPTWEQQCTWLNRSYWPAFTSMPKTDRVWSSEFAMIHVPERQKNLVRSTQSTHLKFNSEFPLKSDRNPKMKVIFQAIIFQGRAVKLSGCNSFYPWRKGNSQPTFLYFEHLGMYETL